jgi:OOP family OmpA-OmpF porin
METIRKFLIIQLLALLAFGCATTPPIPKEKILQHATKIKELQDQLKSASEAGVDYLAPSGFAKAKQQLTDAYEIAQTQKFTEADKIASQGLRILKKAKANAETSRKIMDVVLTLRRRTERAGAPSLFPEEMTDWEKEFREATKLIERGRIEEAKDLRPKLSDGFSKLELKSIKANVAKEAVESIARAKEKNADSYAPKTFKQAERELDLTYSVLDADRLDLERANGHAQNAINYANRSILITDIMNQFDKRRFSQEDIILWHQNDLAKIGGAAGMKLVFGEPDSTTTDRISSAVSSVVASEQAAKQKIENMLQANQQELARMRAIHEEELALQNKQQEEKERREKQAREHFETVQALFNKEEAIVYRVKKDILLAVHGFYFRPGSSEIESSNFMLLKKIARAISEYKNADIIISGHTDSTGDAKLNLAISKERARKVAKFLSEVEGVNPNRIQVAGFGKERPIASNETYEGRSLNRRVEVLIKNPGR